MALSVAEAQSLWSPELVYLNTASFGLPPRPAWEALQADRAGSGKPKVSLGIPTVSRPATVPVVAGCRTP